jgi:hypothetical protein
MGAASPAKFALFSIPASKHEKWWSKHSLARWTYVHATSINVINVKIWMCTWYRVLKFATAKSGAMIDVEASRTSPATKSFTYRVLPQFLSKSDES